MTRLIISLLLLAAFMTGAVVEAGASPNTAAQANKIYLEASKAIRAGEYQSAIPQLKKVIKLLPHWRLPHIDLGACLRKNGAEPDETEKALKRAVEKNPQSSRAYFELGRFHEDHKRFPLAERAFRKALELSAWRKEIKVRLAAVIIAHGDNLDKHGAMGAAEKAYQRALRLTHGQKEIKGKLAAFLTAKGTVLEKRGELAAAEKTYWRAFQLTQGQEEIKNKLAAILMLKGNFLERRGDLKSAERVYKQAFYLTSEEKAIAYKLAWVLYSGKKFPEAQKVFEFILEKDPRHFSSLSHLANIHFKLGRYGPAIKTQKRLIALFPKHWVFHAQLAYLLKKAGKRWAARRRYRIARRLRIVPREFKRRKMRALWRSRR